ncbi:tetratricopeptide repeat protein [Streptomyces sp. NPDC049954]|uniref:tetratricopeptide repeat protein n=1 Tax=Streptomyces sp. NPDC049954 TaxID=3155779 RepID=UPI003439564E
MTDQVVDTSGPAARARPGEAPPPEPGPPLLLGRERELKELREDIGRTGLDTLTGHKAPRARVLLIAGRPGSGRTALARELAGQLTERYPDGLLYARLTDPDGSPVPAARTARRLLGELGVVAPAGTPEDDLLADLRAAFTGRRALLVLDDAAEAGQVDLLLPDTPACLVVAVAAGPLTGIPDVRPCALGGIGVRAGVTLLERRAGRVRVTVDPQSAERLVEECGGQPAALVLAGGWLAARPMASIADLVSRLRGSREEAAETAERGSGPLERMLRHSYEGLSASDRRILRLLHLAPEGLADPHTASALAGCSVASAAGSLEGLAAYGLLRTLPGAWPAYQVPGCLQPVLRAFAEETDRPGELQLARARMLERTVRLLQSCRAAAEPGGAPAGSRPSGLPGAPRFPDGPAAAGWLAARAGALHAAARLAVAEGEFDTLARRLVAALVRALVAHRGAEGAAAELYDLHGLVLDVAERRGLHRERAAALLNLADLDAGTGRTGKALARYRAALEAAREGRDPQAVGRAMESVAGAHQELGDPHRAADWYGRALAHRLTRDEHADVARLYGRIAAVHAHTGQYGPALRNWRSAVAAHRRTGDLPAQARALAELARTQECAGRTEEYAGRAEECLRTWSEALGRAREAGEDRLEAALRTSLADTLDRLGDPAAARLHRDSARDLLGEEAPAADETDREQAAPESAPVAEQPAPSGERAAPAGTEVAGPGADAAASRAETASPGEGQEPSGERPESSGPSGEGPDASADEGADEHERPTFSAQAPARPRSPIQGTQEPTGVHLRNP